MNKVLILTDNEILLTGIQPIINKLNPLFVNDFEFEYAYSYNNKSFAFKYSNSDWIHKLNVKENVEYLLNRYSLIISLHCKQLFPVELVKKKRCINVHPGLNPFNRGWYPQVFSIINGLPCGATIHEMDEFLDHGPVICQKEVLIESWDTSFSAYNKILDAELDLFEKYLVTILYNNYTKEIKEEGNINWKMDFDKLCNLDLRAKDTFLNHINHLRALTHGDYANAFFIDNSGNKVFIKVELHKEESK